jgi:hypothetical protein
MDNLTDRLTMWALRSVATAILFAGVSVLVAGVPLFGMLPEFPVARAIAAVLFQISALFVVSGATAMYLSRPRARWLPNERATTSDAERPGVGGWLIALAIVLVALPVWLLLRLQPFLTEWSRVVDVLSASDLWQQGANANMSGIVLVPLAGALTPPLFELAALFAFVVASAVLLPLLLSRSRRFPRIYLVCGVLLSRARDCQRSRGRFCDAGRGGCRATHRRLERTHRGGRPVEGRPRPLHEYCWFNGAGCGVGVVGLSLFRAGDDLLATGTDNVCEQCRRS